MDTLALQLYAAMHNGHRAKMRMQASVVIGVGGRFPYDVIDYDPEGLCTTGASAVYTCPTDGYYRVVMHSQAVSTVDYTDLVVNSRIGGTAFGSYYSGAITYISGASDVIKCIAGDLLYGAIGGGSGITTVANGSFITFEYVGPA